jgi:elongation factor G
MTAFTSDALRNICVAGHGTSGKTTLVESLLFNAGAVNRQGTVEDGNTVSDFTEEEKNRGISISASINSCEYKKCLISFVDTPGYFDFAGEVAATIPFCEAAILTVKGSSGLDAGTQNAFNTAKRLHKSIAFFVTEIDRDNIDLDSAFESIGKELEIPLAPITFPAGSGMSVDSIIDVFRGKLVKYANGKKVSESEIPAEFADKAAQLKEKLMEAVAESEESLMEKYFAEGTLSDEEINIGLAKAFANGSVFPVFFGAANKGIGVDCLLDAVVDFFPSPEGKVSRFSEGEIDLNPKSSVRGIILKVNTIPQFGEVFIFKLLQGEISEGSDIYNINSSSYEKFGQLFYVRGKERVSVKTVTAGQIAATVKLKNTKTGDQFADNKNAEVFPFKLIEWPEAIVRGAFMGVSKEDTDKVAAAIKKMQIEDASFRFVQDAELKQLFVDGLGELHLEVISKKIKNQFGLDVKIVEPRVPYRETIKGKAEARYRHKKQSGGSGEFAEVNIVLEPTPDADFEFVDAIVGGVISNRFIPAVEKGIREILPEGVLSGCRFINCKVTLNDGKEHPVDSKEVAFKKAAQMAFRDAVKRANPIILEPIYNMLIKVPEEFAGSVMGDISSRRGKPQGMESEGKYTVVKALIPLKEIHGYSTQLRSMTNGRGTYTISFDHYEPVPGDVQKKIVEEYEASKEQ